MTDKKWIEYGVILDPSGSIDVYPTLIEAIRNANERTPVVKITHEIIWDADDD